MADTKSHQPQKPLTGEQSKRIALIIGSTRPQRVGPFVASFVHEHLESLLTKEGSLSGRATITIIDLKDHPLPLYEEPHIPSLLPSSNTHEHYQHDHTAKWSQVIAPFDGYIFLTSQHNWSIPSGLKNSLDYLFHEWSYKPAGIISYGGHGGDKAAAHLVDVCGGLRMRPSKEVVNIVVPRAVLGGLDKGGVVTGEMKSLCREMWKAEGVLEKVQAMWKDVVRMAERGVVGIQE